MSKAKYVVFCQIGAKYHCKEQTPLSDRDPTEEPQSGYSRMFLPWCGPLRRPGSRWCPVGSELLLESVLPSDPSSLVGGAAFQHPPSQVQVFLSSLLMLTPLFLCRHCTKP